MDIVLSLVYEVEELSGWKCNFYYIWCIKVIIIGLRVKYLGV